MGSADEASANPRLGIFLAAAMFVFVIDTSFMNVSISAVVRDLDTTVSGVQSAVAIEALVSAAFILISSKVGDLFGRKRAFVAGLLFYCVGALAMVFAQGLAAIIVFWAVVGGLGASLYLPAMQSLIHGNFEGKERAKVFALVGASGAIAAAIGPLIGGFVTTLFSWRVGFLIECLIIVVVLAGSEADPRRSVHGRSVRRRVGAALSVIGMGGLDRGRPRLAGGRRGGGGPARGRHGGRWRPRLLARLAEAGGQSHAARSVAVQVEAVHCRRERDLPPAGGAGRDADRAADLPAARLGYNAFKAGITLAPLSLTMFASRCSRAGAPGGGARASSSSRGSCCSPWGSRSSSRSCREPTPAGTWRSRWCSPAPGSGLMSSQLNNYALSPISEERVGEAAGVNSATGSFGLSFGLAFAGAIMLATLSISFTNMAESSSVLPPADQQHVADVLEDDAQVMSDAQLQELLAGQPEAIQEEILSINTDARHLALQVALLVHAPRLGRRHRQRVPHDAAARSPAVDRGRRDGAWLTCGPQYPQRDSNPRYRRERPAS